MRTPLSSTATSAAPDAVFIGGSAGALEVVALVLGALPAAFAPTVVVLIHLPRRRPSALADALRGRCRLPVREPEDREPLAPGTVYVAPPDYHLLVDPGPVFALSVDEPVNFSLPSIDVLFAAAADVLRARCAGVVVSGASADGAEGLWAIAAQGGLAIVQAPAEAPHPAMPEAALARCPGARVLPARAIGEWLRELATGPRHEGAPSHERSA